MPHDPRRRAVIRAVGLGAAGACLPASSRAYTPLRRGADLRIALLLPSVASGSSSTASAFRDGFALAADAPAGRRMAVDVREVGEGIGRVMAFAREQRAHRDVDVAVAMASARATRWLAPDLAAARVPLVVVNAGERIVTGDSVDPGVAYVSLELARAAYESGRYAALHAGRRCAIACSWYESGYDMVAAFRAGFAAEGGRVVASHVSGSPQSTIDAAGAAGIVARAGADVIAAFYTGDEAHAFFSALPRVAATVIGSPLVTAAQASGVAVASVTPWSPGLDAPASRAFVAAFEARFARTPDMLAMLGYETARTLAHAPADSRRLVASLRTRSLEGAREGASVDPRTNEITTDFHLRALDAGGEETLSAWSPASASPHLASLLPRRNGWINPYFAA